MRTAFVAAVLLSSSSALAGAESQRRVLDEARAAERSHDWQRAIAAFDRAAQFKDSPAIRLHRGLCLDQLGRLVDASNEFAAASELLAAGAKDEDVARLLPGKIAELQDRVPTMKVSVPPGMGAEIMVDGHTLNPVVAGQRQPLDPGSHELRVSAEGRQPYATTVTLTEGMALTENVDLPLLPTPRPTRRAEVTITHHPGPARIWDWRGLERGDARSWVLAGEAAGTLTAMTFGVVYGFQAIAADQRIHHAQDTIDARDRNACAATPPDLAAACSGLRPDFEARTKEQRHAAYAFGAAGAGAVALVVTALVWPSRPIVLAPVQGGLSIAGRF